MHKPFVNEIADRFKLPWSSFAFNSYFFVIVLGFGGIGVFAKIWEVILSPNCDGFEVAKDMSTYSIAIIAASLVDLNLTDSIQSKPSLTINSIALFGISMFLILLSYTLPGYWPLIPSVLGTLIALVVWILANADNENLSDSQYYDKMRGKNVGHGNNWTSE